MDELDIEAMADRSDELMSALLAVLTEGPDGYQTFDGEQRAETSAAAAGLALEHGSALRLLLRSHYAASGAAMLRMQFEGMVRSAWLLYAATDLEVGLVQAPLNEEAERRANSLPMFGLMLKALEVKAPARLFEDLQQIKAVLGRAMNSYVHSGIHAVNRHQFGFPIVLARQVMASSNGIGTMAAMMLANLTGDSGRGAEINRLIPAFADCLPQLLPRLAGQGTRP